MTDRFTIESLENDRIALRALQAELRLIITARDTDADPGELVQHLAESAGRAIDAYGRHGAPMVLEVGDLTVLGANPVKNWELIGDDHSGLSAEGLLWRVGSALGRVESRIQLLELQTATTQKSLEKPNTIQSREPKSRWPMKLLVALVTLFLAPLAVNYISELGKQLDIWP